MQNRRHGTPGALTGSAVHAAISHGYFSQKEASFRATA